MKKKKILIITPVSPHPSDTHSILSPLAFLEEEYTLHPIDSLSIMNDKLSKEAYYRLWEQKLAPEIPYYDAFFGFSFGGIILQQCFSLFASINKPIILFSAPTFADKTLYQKLGEVISLCKENKLKEAMSSLYQNVYYPNHIPPEAHQIIDKKTATERMIFGLNQVLETDSRQILKNSKINHLHLIGELSHLVNAQNVVAPNIGRLLNVPGAGMRIFLDNPSFCKQAILETLNHEI